MTDRIYTDTPGHDRTLLGRVVELTRDGDASGSSFAVVVFEREEIAGGRAYLAPVLFTGDAGEIGAAIDDYVGPDGDGDITTDSWLEASAGIEPDEIGFED